jgi:hypothetical protein
MGDIKIDLREKGWGVEWLHVAQDTGEWWAVENTVMNLRVPYHAANFLSGCVTVAFSRTRLHGDS